jgi:trans-2,3-dihydro-3-hydroxyanthranilate isomerase
VDEDGATLTGGRPSLEDGVALDALAAAVGLTAADTVGLPAKVAGCGLPFTYLAVRPGLVDAATPDVAALSALGVGEGVSVFSWDPATSTAYARVFAGDVAWEDPATGSAALGLGVWLADAGLVAPDATDSFVIRQGELLGRPSLLECTVTASGGSAVAATVRGGVVPIAAGRIRIP